MLIWGRGKITALRSIRASQIDMMDKAGCVRNIFDTYIRSKYIWNIFGFLMIMSQYNPGFALRSMGASQIDMMDKAGCVRNIFNTY